MAQLTIGRDRRVFTILTHSLGNEFGRGFATGDASLGNGDRRINLIVDLQGLDHHFHGIIDELKDLFGIRLGFDRAQYFDGRIKMLMAVGASASRKCTTALQ